MNGKQIWNFQPPLGKVPERPHQGNIWDILGERALIRIPSFALTDHSASDPLILRTTLTDVMGTDPSDEGEKFDMAGRRSVFPRHLEPRNHYVFGGFTNRQAPTITPRILRIRKISKALDQKKYLWKLGRRFDFNLGDPWIAFGGNSNECREVLRWERI